MIAAWILWSVGAGLLFLVAGLAMERLMDGGRRWVWAGAGAGTVALTAVRVLSGSGGGAGGSAEATGVIHPVPAGPEGVAGMVAPGLPEFAVPYDSSLHALDGVLLVGWAVLSLGLALRSLIGIADILHRRRFWERGTLLGRPVLWARNAGPAVVGLVRPRMVFPAWVRTMEPRRQALILAHEEEHLRAGDGILRFLMGVLLIVFPWNPALWLHYRRLCLGMELDCDQRVMKRLPHRRWLYGDLLFHVGARTRARPGLAMAAFAERPSFLERRIRKLLGRAPAVGMAQVAFLAFAAIMVIGVAVWIPGITKEMNAPEVKAVPEAVTVEIEPETGELIVSGGVRRNRRASVLVQVPVPVEVEPDADPREQRQFVVHTVRPRMLNPEEMDAALTREYPALLKDAGIGGTTIVYLFIDRAGEVADARVKEGSGHRGLDDAALKVARVARYSPALNGDEPVALWVETAISFGAS